MKIKACIFDLDGVLVDTAKFHYIAWKRIADELGFEFSEEHNEQLKGVSRMRSLEILLEVGNITKSEEEMNILATKKNEWYVDFIKELDPSEILPGVREFLDDLKKNKVKIALGSASKNAGLILDRLEIRHYFDSIIDGNKVTNAKPDPEVFSKGAAELGLLPPECVVFEDAVAGIEAAKNGGMRSIGIGKPEILVGADIVIAGFQKLNWNRLIEWLQK